MPFKLYLPYSIDQSRNTDNRMKRRDLYIENLALMPDMENLNGMLSQSIHNRVGIVWNKLVTQTCGKWRRLAKLRLCFQQMRRFLDGCQHTVGRGLAVLCAAIGIYFVQIIQSLRRP